jgi:hypothetical protein
MAWLSWVGLRQVRKAVNIALDHGHAGKERCAQLLAALHPHIIDRCVQGQRTTQHGLDESKSHVPYRPSYTRRGLSPCMKRYGAETLYGVYRPSQALLGHARPY